MGDEYIKRSDVLIKLEIAYDMARLDQKLPISDLQHEVNLIKAADVQPIRHGRWTDNVYKYVKSLDAYFIQAKCSVCGRYSDRIDIYSRFMSNECCSRCGARMDAEPDEPWQSE